MGEISVGNHRTTELRRRVEGEKNARGTEDVRGGDGRGVFDVDI